MQRKGRCRHEDAKAAGDHPGMNLNLPAKPAAPGPRLSTESRAAALSGPSKGPPHPPGAEGDGTSLGLYIPPIARPRKLCPSEHQCYSHPPRAGAGAASSPGQGWLVHPNPGSSPQPRASRPRLVQLGTITAPAIPKQTQTPHPEKRPALWARVPAARARRRLRGPFAPSGTPGERGVLAARRALCWKPSPAPSGTERLRHSDATPEPQSFSPNDSTNVLPTSP